MRSAMLRKVLMAPAILVAMMVAAAATTPAGERTFFCHSTSFPRCLGVFSVAGSALSFNMAGTPALAVVDEFTEPAVTRNVTWTTIEMRGTTETGEDIIATLDPDRQSSGTVLSVGNTEFPATATMRFFFRMEVGGMTLLSEHPAVFQGIIHSIPPAAGDVLTLISGPVEFHQEGEPDLKIGALEESAVSFGDGGSAAQPATGG